MGGHCPCSPTGANCPCALAGLAHTDIPVGEAPPALLAPTTAPPASAADLPWITLAALSCLAYDYHYSHRSHFPPCACHPPKRRDLAFPKAPPHPARIAHRLATRTTPPPWRSQCPPAAHGTSSQLFAEMISAPTAQPLRSTISMALSRAASPPTALTHHVPNWARPFLTAAVALGDLTKPVGVRGAAALARFSDAAHHQVGGPVILVWDNLNAHVSRTMRELIAARSWLTVYQLPPYAPEFNPVEGVRSHLKRSLANLTKHSLQYRPRLIQGLITKTGLDLQPLQPR